MEDGNDIYSDYFLAIASVICLGWNRQKEKKEATGQREVKMNRCVQDKWIEFRESMENEDAQCKFKRANRTNKIKGAANRRAKGNEEEMVGHRM